MTKDERTKVGDAGLPDTESDNQSRGCEKVVERLAYRPQEVSEAIGLSKPLIYGLLKSGTMRSIRVNNSYLIPLTTLREDLESLAGKEITI